MHRESRIKRIANRTAGAVFLILIGIAHKAQGQYGLNEATPIGLQKDMDTLLPGIIKSILSVVGIIFLILLIWGGVVWMTAAGNQERIGKAKKVIIGALIGIVIIILAYAITMYITLALTEPEKITFAINNFV